MKASDTSDKSLHLLNSYKDPELARGLLDKVCSYGKKISIMEVCGTHTVALFRTGIRSGLPENLHLVSGPGCPVCVTPVEIMEKTINPLKQRRA